MTPFIVTTKRPVDAVDCGRPEAPRDGWPVSRRAVATLEEARHAAHDVMLGRAGEADPVWPEGSNSANWNAVDRFPESGGTVGPLPDGTVIEVESSTAQTLIDSLDVQTLRDLWIRHPACVPLTEIIAAFNAREA